MPIPAAIEAMAKERSLSSLFRRKSTKEEDRFYAMYYMYLEPSRPGLQAYITCINDDDDDDGGSINSFSTTATVDNNPGTGRVLDTYFFQPAGRRIERLAMRFSIRHLHPWRISAFINDAHRCNAEIMKLKVSLDQALGGFYRVQVGPTVVAGLKSLVRQAQ